MAQYSFALGAAPILPTIRTRLLAQYGPQRDILRHDPMSQLIKAMVGSRTRDEVSRLAFERLQDHYSSWNLLGKASPAEIEATIRTVTHAERKAEQIPRALRMIVARSGRLNLDFLADWDEEMAMQWLRGLHGVRSKIAATVLNFSTLRKRALVVDTHLLRIGVRLQLLSWTADYESGYDAYMRLVPDAWDANDLYEFHWLMKYHGQWTCVHWVPACTHCLLRDLCPQSASPRSRTGASKLRRKPAPSRTTSLRAERWSENE